MAKRIIVLSGHVGSGKTTLASGLVRRFGFCVLKTRDLIKAATGVDAERGALQHAGERLDRRTGGKWVAAALASEVGMLAEDAVVLVDSIRIGKQLSAIRSAFGARVVHIHLTASENTLATRYAERRSEVAELATYDEVRANATERRVGRLATVADIVIDTERSAPEDVIARVASHLGLYGRGLDRLVDVVVGGQYGSEGKGNIVSYLAHEYDLLVRVGGPNAGHTVYEEPKPYTFHHLPSGTRRTESRLLIGPGAVIRVRRLLEEIAECEVSAERLTIDRNAMVIEDGDIEFEESRLRDTIGSTAQGGGVATARKVLRLAADPPVRLAASIEELRPYVGDSLEVLERAFSEGQKVLLEGTQGTGLSLHHGSYPHVTSRETSVSGCLAEAGIAPSRVRRIVLVCRTYPIRVESPKDGDSGPMAREVDWEAVSQRSGIPREELEAKEKTSTTKRRRRVGEFDWALLRKATSLNGPTDIALTFADYLSSKNSGRRRFDQLTQETIRFVEEVEHVASAPVSLISTGFNSRNIIDRRKWK